MPLRLVESGAPPESTHEILVNKEEFLIGRGRDCDLQINEAEISRHHCMLRGRDEQYSLLDLGSSNGTFLNGHRLLSQATLQEGDEVRVGKHTFRITLDEREGIRWGTEEGVSATDDTFRLAKLKKELEAVRQQAIEGSNEVEKAPADSTGS
jgi:S-DNA-T family DNA segregation ATPase FtsK/SpoIIIE